MKPIFIFSLCFFSVNIFSQDTVEVYFIYGSKPLTDSESRWFGGKLGGHVGMGFSEDSVFHFNPGGKVGAFGHKDSPGTWRQDTKEEFLCTFGCDSNQILIVKIPISAEERIAIRTTALRFLDSSPYPYAFFGMRCTSSCYHLLSQTHWFKKKGKSRMIRNYFYPRKLRKELLKQAKKNHWETELTIGRSSRKWDHD
jgi:hypothetical protein